MNIETNLISIIDAENKSYKEAENSLTNIMDDIVEENCLRDERLERIDKNLKMLTKSEHLYS